MSARKIPEWIKSRSGSGSEPELIKETEWRRVYKVDGAECHISKFLDEGLTIDAAVLRQRWPNMTELERMEFASNFSCKPEWTENDTAILDTILGGGNDRIWTCCALAMLRHPDRDRIVHFLIERLEHTQLEHGLLNYIQALGMAKDRRATAAIRPYFDKYRKAMEAESVSGVPEDVFFGPVPYHAFLVAGGALFEIERAPEYEHAVRKYLDHSNEQVRWWAESVLGVEGPTTLKRRKEYENKHSGR